MSPPFPTSPRRPQERPRKDHGDLTGLASAGSGNARCGYQVHACEYPPDALLLFQENSQQFDLVITDLQMPGLDGIELAAELLKINPTLPVVLTSAVMFQMPSEKLQRLGIRDFLIKPWDRVQLFAIIRQALASKQPRDETSKN